MTFRETNSKAETDALYKEYLAENHKTDCEEAYNDFYNKAENAGFNVSLLVPLDKELSKKLGMAIPTGEECWYELHKK